MTQHTAIITGASSGLGRCIAKELESAGFVVYSIADKIHANIPGKYVYELDLRDPAQIEKFCAQFQPDDPDFDGQFILINCAGINEINWLQDLELAQWTDVMDVNARAIFLMTKGLLGMLAKAKGTVLNIISNASHMPMTGSLAYNASKGAAHIMTLQLARELTKAHGITVFGISPNKMAGTAMSRYIERRVPEVRGWTPEYAAAYQQQSILAGEETDPQTLAEFITYLLIQKQHHKYLTGCIIPYGA